MKTLKTLMIIIPLILILILIGFGIYEQFGTNNSKNDYMDGSFVIMQLDAANKPTKYWVVDNNTVEKDGSWVSFEEKDGQTIHIHSNMIMKEYDSPEQLEAIKKEYGLK